MLCCRLLSQIIRKKRQCKGDTLELFPIGGDRARSDSQVHMADHIRDQFSVEIDLGLYKHLRETCTGRKTCASENSFNCHSSPSLFPCCE